MKRSSAYKWTVLAILMLGTAILYYSNMIFAVRALDTLSKFNIDEGELAAISTIGCLPGAFLSIIVGRVLDKKGVKLFTALTLALTVACMVWRIFAHTYIELLLGDGVLIGTFLLPITIVGPKMVGIVFRPEEMALAMGFFGAAGGLGTTLAFATATPIRASRPPSPAWPYSARCCSSAGCSSSRSPRRLRCPRARPPRRTRGGFAKVLKSKNLWKVMFCTGFAVGASLLINTYITQAFTARGASIEMASTIGTVLNFCLILGGIISGAVIGKLGKINIPYAFICIVGGAFYLLGYLLPIGAWTYVLMAIGGIICSGSVGVSFTRIPLLPLTGDFEPDSIGTAAGMNQTALGIMSFALPTIIASAARQQLHGGLHHRLCVPGALRHRGPAHPRAGRERKAGSVQEVTGGSQWIRPIG